MIKNVFITFAILNAFMYASAMEVEVKTDNHQICWFSIIDENILNIIASFLTFNDINSEQKFIDRTKAIKQEPLPKEYLSHFSMFKPNQNNCNLILPVENADAYADCPFNETIAILVGKTLIIVDKKINQKLYEKQIDEDTCTHIAVSGNKTMFAILSQKDEFSLSRAQFTEVINYKKVLSITNIISQKKETYIIPDRFSGCYKSEYPVIAFNKQGTHVIFHGFDCRQGLNRTSLTVNGIEKDPISHHAIFSVTVNACDQSADNKKTLKKYFQEQLVCKNFT